MRVVFATIASKELRDAIHYYNLEYEGLGDRFRSEVRAAIDRMQSYPLAYSVESGDVRRCPLYKFPYKILYSNESDHLLIIAIAHQHRKPSYWIARQLH